MRVTMIDRQPRGTQTQSCRPFVHIFYTRRFFETTISPELTSSASCPTTTGDLGRTILINCSIRFPDWFNIIIIIITCTTHTRRMLWFHVIFFRSEKNYDRIIFYYNPHSFSLRWIYVYIIWVGTMQTGVRRT